MLEENVLVMNKAQAKKKFYVFPAVFRVDVNDIKPFQNPTGRLPADHFLDLQSMPRLLQTTNRWLNQILLSTVYYGDQAGYATINMIT